MTILYGRVMYGTYDSPNCRSVSRYNSDEAKLYVYLKNEHNCSERFI